MKTPLPEVHVALLSSLPLPVMRAMRCIIKLPAAPASSNASPPPLASADLAEPTPFIPAPDQVNSSFFLLPSQLYRFATDALGVELRRTQAEMRARTTTPPPRAYLRERRAGMNYVEKATPSLYWQLHLGYDTRQTDAPQQPTWGVTTVMPALAYKIMDRLVLGLGAGVHSSSQQPHSGEGSDWVAVESLLIKSERSEIGIGWRELTPTAGGHSGWRAFSTSGRPDGTVVETTLHGRYFLLPELALGAILWHNPLSDADLPFADRRWSGAITAEVPWGDWRSELQITRGLGYSSDDIHTLAAWTVQLQEFYAISDTWTLDSTAGWNTGEGPITPSPNAPAAATRGARSTGLFAAYSQERSFTFSLGGTWRL